jgi:hypothetical protein
MSSLWHGLPKVPLFPTLGLAAFDETLRSQREGNDDIEFRSFFVEIVLRFPPLYQHRIVFAIENSERMRLESSVSLLELANVPRLAIFVNFADANCSVPRYEFLEHPRSIPVNVVVWDTFPRHA